MKKDEKEIQPKEVFRSRLVATSQCFKFQWLDEFL